MIPKKIHYCWFGGNNLPELALKCINSWKKYCPDYEIIEWNETNFDINFCAYTKEAYKAKKWAFVSDVARFKILYDNGGIYFDTDVEMIKSIEDIIARGPFMGVEPEEDGMVAPGLGICARKEEPFYKTMLDFYANKHFQISEFEYDYTTVVRYTTKMLEIEGFKRITDIQCINNIYIYPEDFFCPLNHESGKLNITCNTRTIHHYSGSWLTDEQIKIHKIEVRLNARYNTRVASILIYLYTIPYRLRGKIRTFGLKNTIKFILHKYFKL